MTIERIAQAAQAEGVPAHIIAAGRAFFLRKNRLEQVPGEFDKIGRFYPDERTAAVEAVRAPSKAYPYSEMNAARTAMHCAQVHRVEDEHIIIIKRIALSADRGDSVDDARRFIGAAWQKIIRAEVKRLVAA